MRSNIFLVKTDYFYLTIAFDFAIRLIPAAIVTMMTAGKPSGRIATATPTAYNSMVFEKVQLDAQNTTMTKKNAIMRHANIIRFNEI